jgi:hypothetical protein
LLRLPFGTDNDRQGAQQMKAIKIDAHARTVTEIEIGDPNKDYRQLAEGIGFGCLYTELISYVNRENDCLMGDEEGLFKKDQAFFWWKGYPTPLAGNAIVVGTDDMGNTTAPTMTLAEVQASVDWTTPARAVDVRNQQRAEAEAVAAMMNMRGGAFMVVAAPVLELNEDGTYPGM